MEARVKKLAKEVSYYPFSPTETEYYNLTDFIEGQLMEHAIFDISLMNKVLARFQVFRFLFGSDYFRKLNKQKNLQKLEREQKKKHPGWMFRTNTQMTVLRTQVIQAMKKNEGDENLGPDPELEPNPNPRQDLVLEPDLQAKSHLT